MSQQDPFEINQLIGRFMDLQEEWERDPEAFDWGALQALAQQGVHAYNEGAGPSFHALALDGVEHKEFHECFLGYLLQAGFDPFKLTRAGTGTPPLPVLDHASLAEAALSNPSSARMHASLMEEARKRFGKLADDIRSGKMQLQDDMLRRVEVCAESFPLDLLQAIAPELARPHHGETRRQVVDPVEGYLSPAEQMVDNSSRPYG